MGIFDFLKKKAEIPEEYKNIDLFLQDVKKKKKVPFKASPEVLKALIEIANTPNWYEQLDKETIKSLEQMFNKWESYTQPKKQTELQKTGKSHGFTKYWSGTEEELQEAIRKGLIDEYTKITIIKYTGTVLELKEDGSIQEYME